jgi:hypothetical protein
MHFLNFLYAALLSASGAEALRSDKVKLSNIQSLTLRKGLDTSHRRVDAMPQVCASLSQIKLRLISTSSHASVALRKGFTKST